MTYLLYSDTLIFMIRGLKSKSARRLAERRGAQSLMDHCRKSQAAGDSVGLSAVTVSELEFGARKSRDYEEEFAAVRKVLTPFDVYDYDSVACRQNTEGFDDLEARGESIGAMDLMIAAHALALDATLVTNNAGHFSRVKGFKVVNWLSKG